MEYYKTICAATKLPVIAYNVPPRTGVNILPATAEELASIPNMAGIKEACGNMEQICETMRRIRGKMDLYSGDDNLNVPILAIGGAALISVASNIIPADVAKLCKLCSDGDFKAAAAEYFRLADFFDKLFIETNPIPVKTAMNLAGLNVGRLRLPLVDMAEGTKAQLIESMHALGIATV